MPAPPSPASGNMSPRQMRDHGATPGNVPMYADDGTLMDSGVTPSGGGGGGGGGLVLLEEHTASGSASLDFTTRNVTGQSGATFQSDYDEYMIQVANIVPVTNQTTLWLLFSSNGGSSWINSGTPYSYAAQAFSTGGIGNGGNGAMNQLQFHYSNSSGDNPSSTASNGGISAFYRLYNPLSTSMAKKLRGEGATGNGSVNSFGWQWQGTFITAATAVNAFQILMSSGNIASGSVRLYGFAK